MVNIYVIYGYRWDTWINGYRWDFTIYTILYTLVMTNIAMENPL